MPPPLTTQEKSSIDRSACSDHHRSCSGLSLLPLRAGGNKSCFRSSLIFVVLHMLICVCFTHVSSAYFCWLWLRQCPMQVVLVSMFHPLRIHRAARMVAYCRSALAHLSITADAREMHLAYSYRARAHDRLVNHPFRPHRAIKCRISSYGGQSVTHDKDIGLKKISTNITSCASQKWLALRIDDHRSDRLLAKVWEIEDFP